MAIDRYSRFFTGFIAALLFCSYPLAIISPFGTDFLGISYNFDFHISIVPIATLASSIYLLAYFPWQNRKNTTLIQRIQLFVIMAMAVWLAQKSFSSIAVLKHFGYLLIPMAIASAGERAFNGHYLPKYTFAIVFILTCSHTIVSPSAGLSGNINWVAASYLASLPLFIFTLKKIKNKALQLPISLLFGIYGLYQWIQADSRASFLAAGAASVYILVIFLKNRQFYKSTVAVIVICFIAMAILFQTAVFKRAEARDIRLPVWQATSNMVLAQPLKGHGPGNFLRDFPQFRTDEQQLRIVSGIKTAHPHNEILFIASEMGLPFLFLVLALIYFCLNLKKTDPAEKKLAAFTVVTLMVHGQLDKTLYQDPTSLMCLILMGVCLQKTPLSVQSKKVTHEDELPFSPIKLALPLLFAILLFAYGALDIIKYSQSSALLRSARMSYDEEISKQQPDRQVITRIVNDLLEADKAYPNPDALLYASLTALNSLQDPQMALPILQKLNDEWPGYSQIDRFIAQCFELFASHQKNVSEQQKFLTQSSHFYQRNAAKFVGSYDALYESYNALLRINDINAAEAIYNQMAQTSDAKFYESTFARGIQFDADEWSQAALKGNSKAIKLAKSYLSHFRLKSGGDAVFDDLKHYKSISNFPSAPFNTFDLIYWRDLMVLKKRYPENLQEAITRIVQETQITQNRNAGDFSKIRYKDKTLTAAECMALISELAIQKNSDALLLKRGLIWQAFVFYNDNIITVTIDNKRLITGSIKLNTFRKNYAKSYFQLFAEASSLCNRNEILSLILRNPEGQKLLNCYKPSLRLIRLQKKLGFSPRISLMQEPFNAFSQNMAAKQR